MRVTFIAALIFYYQYGYTKKSERKSQLQLPPTHLIMDKH